MSREEPSDSADDGDGYSYLTDRGGPSTHIASAPAPIYEFMDNIRSSCVNAAGGVAKKKTTHHVVSDCAVPSAYPVKIGENVLSQPVPSQ